MDINGLLKKINIGDVNDNLSYLELDNSHMEQLLKDIYSIVQDDFGYSIDDLNSSLEVFGWPGTILDPGAYSFIINMFAEMDGSVDENSETNNIQKDEIATGTEQFTDETEEENKVEEEEGDDDEYDDDDDIPDDFYEEPDESSEIESCTECSFFLEASSFHEDSCCRIDNTRPIELLDKIPEWCPIEQRIQTGYRIMARHNERKNLRFCSFCEKSQGDVQKIVSGPGVYICNECVDRFNVLLNNS